MLDLRERIDVGGADLRRVSPQLQLSEGLESHASQIGFVAMAWTHYLQSGS